MDLASGVSEKADSAKNNNAIDGKTDNSKIDFDKSLDSYGLDGLIEYKLEDRVDFDKPIEICCGDGDIDFPFDVQFEERKVIECDGDVNPSEELRNPKHFEDMGHLPSGIQLIMEEKVLKQFENNNSEVDSSRIDDNGKEYKDENGDLLPNTEYTVNGTTYHTDELGRIIDWEGELKDTPENERDKVSQAESGGKDRKEGDDGGHLQGRQNGGSSGNENLVPMRDTVNRGDYLKTENEENQMLKEGKNVTEKGELTYNEDSSRPTKIHKEYSDGEKTVKADFDNEVGSKDLLDKLEDDISDEDLQSLKDEIADMEADGNEVTVTSVKKDYDSEGNLKSTTVGVRNETTGEKSYRTFTTN